MHIRTSHSLGDDDAMTRCASAHVASVLVLVAVAAVAAAATDTRRDAPKAAQAHVNNARSQRHATAADTRHSIARWSGDAVGNRVLQRLIAAKRCVASDEREVCEIAKRHLSHYDAARL